MYERLYVRTYICIVIYTVCMHVLHTDIHMHVRIHINTVHMSGLPMYRYIEQQGYNGYFEKLSQCL